MKEFIQQQILEIADGRKTSPPWQQAVARAHNVLPLYGDLGGALALGQDLEIYAIPDDPQQTIYAETNSVLRNMALLRAGEKYPELILLRPVRPETTIDCADCEGTGRNPITSHKGFEQVICRCGGLGWLEKGSEE